MSEIIDVVGVALVSALCLMCVAFLLTRHLKAEIKAYEKKYDALAKAYKDMERQRNYWMMKYCNLVGLDADEVDL